MNLRYRLAIVTGADTGAGRSSAVALSPEGCCGPRPWLALVGSAVTPSQYGLLTAIASHGRLDQREAGLRASLDKSSTSDIVRRLERRGLLGIEIDHEDRRRNLLYLWLSWARLSAGLSSRAASLVPFWRRYQPGCVLRGSPYGPRLGPICEVEAVVAMSPRVTRAIGSQRTTGRHRHTSWLWRATAMHRVAAIGDEHRPLDPAR